ncbi:MAG: ribbon-helix-helix protein, CopG family [Acidobacteriales bacterium]|nr:ribbon-helix-helix protein, CopG family [Terriglobales bacterium]
MISAAKERFWFYGDSDILAVVKTLAQQSGASRSEIVRRLIRRGLDKQS